MKSQNLSSIKRGDEGFIEILYLESIRMAYSCFCFHKFARFLSLSGQEKRWLIFHPCLPSHLRWNNRVMSLHITYFPNSLSGNVSHVPSYLSHVSRLEGVVSQNTCIQSSIKSYFSSGQGAPVKIAEQ